MQGFKLFHEGAVAGMELEGIPGGVALRIVWLGRHDIGQAYDRKDPEALALAAEELLAIAFSQLRGLRAAGPAALDGPLPERELEKLDA